MGAILLDAFERAAGRGDDGRMHVLVVAFFDPLPRRIYCLRRPETGGSLTRPPSSGRTGHNDTGPGRRNRPRGSRGVTEVSGCRT